MNLTKLATCVFMAFIVIAVTVIIAEFIHIFLWEVCDIDKPFYTWAIVIGSYVIGIIFYFVF